MPNLLIPIKPTYESVTRYAAHNVVERMMQMTGISSETGVRYASADGGYYQHNSTINQTDEPNRLGHSSRIQVVVTEEYDPDQIINGPVRETEERLIFTDTALDIYLKPVYSATECVIAVDYRCSSRAEADAWRNAIKSRLADNRQFHMHELDFHYPVPRESLVILKHLHTLRENVAGYGDTFGAYLKSHMTDRATSLTTLGGTEAILVIREKEIGVQGWFEFTEPQEADKQSDSPAWTCTFTYRFRYQKPVQVHMVYPLVVHQQVIDAEFYSTESAYDLTTRLRQPGRWLNAAKRLGTAFMSKPQPSIGGVRIPEWDVWLPEQLPPSTTTLVTALTGLQDPQIMGNLLDLGEWVWHPLMEAFLRSEAPYLHKHGESIMYVHGFTGAYPMEGAALRVDDDLTVYSPTPLDLRQQYHLRVALVMDYTRLTPRAINAFIHNGKLAILVFKTLYPELNVDEAATYLLADGSLNIDYAQWLLIRYWDKYYSNTPGRWVGSDIERHLVMQLSVITRHREDI